jgi:hypothetical protein
MSSARRRVDWSFGPGHGPVSGTINAAGAALGIVMWLWLAHISAMWALLTGGLLTAAAAGIALWYDQMGRVVVYRSVSWFLATFWAVWVTARWPGWYLFGKWHIMTFWHSPASPWSWRAVTPLLLVGLVVAYVGWHMDRAERRAAAEAAEREAARLKALEEAKEAARFEREPLDESEATGDRWEPHMQKICRAEGLKILNVELWESGTGFTLEGLLPDDGTVLSDIKIHEESLAASAPEYPDENGNFQGLPDGCGVEIMPNPGYGRRSFLTRVTVRSALGEDVPYPDELLTASNIENPIPLGVETDRRYATIPMRSETTVMIGNTDSGKSNQSNVIATGLGRCTNVLLVGIDLSGNGRWMRPWLTPYYKGQCRRPHFRNIAYTPQRARALCKSLQQIVDGRTADYAVMMANQNSDLLPVSPEVPLIYLMIDEFKRLPDDVQEQVADLVETGRGAGVRVVACSLEATNTGMPKAVLKHARNRIGMRVVDETELVYLFDSSWKRSRFDPASLPWKGSGLYTTGPQFPVKFKGFRIDPHRVFEIAIRLSEFRPAELDAASVARGDTVTVDERSPGNIEEVTYSGIWSNWEADTFPAMFAGHEAQTVTAGAGGTPSQQGGTTATLTREGDDMSSTTERGADGFIPTSDPEGLARQGFAELGQEVADMGGALDRLAGMANGDIPITPEQAGETAEGESGEGGEDGSRAAGGTAGPRTPTADELAAMFDAPTVAEPPRPTGSPWSTPPAPSGPVADPLAAGIAPAGQGKAQGGPSPKRRMYQLIYIAGAAGTTPGAIHDALAAEGYPTSLTTVQNNLKQWKASNMVVQPEGARTAYFRGPNFPTDRL